MRADRGVDATARSFPGVHDIVEPLSHPVKPLKFISLCVAAHVKNRGNRVGVVGGELRIDAVGHSQQFAGIGDVADISGCLRGEDRKTAHALHLGKLDLGIPIGALHKPNHDLAVMGLGESVEVVDHVARAQAVGLNDNAEPVPSRQRGIIDRRVDHGKGKLKPVSLFRVDVEADIGLGGRPQKALQAGNQFADHALFLHDVITGVNR